MVRTFSYRRKVPKYPHVAYASATRSRKKTADRIPRQETLPGFDHRRLAAVEQQGSMKSASSSFVMVLGSSTI